MGFSFKKGTKAEVLNKRELPFGSWWLAEVISGNGHTYYVKYDRFPLDVERVPRKAMRPCPPPTASQSSWMPADIVEVLDNSSWKLAEVSTVLSGDYYLVRLLGSSRELSAHKSKTRLCQIWQDNKWVAIGKESEKSRNEFEELPVGTRKRHRICSTSVETCNTASRKARAVEGHTTELRKKVEAVAYPQEPMGGKYMHASFNNTITGFFGRNMESRLSNSDDKPFFVPNLEPSDDESVSSSVGSSSPTNSPCSSLPKILDLPVDLGLHSDNAETLLVSEIHQLELYAYRTTLAAFHASGHMTWEQEALLTNMRIMLHISTDEQLLELKSLVSLENPFRIPGSNI